MAPKRPPPPVVDPPVASPSSEEDEEGTSSGEEEEEGSSSSEEEETGGLDKKPSSKNLSPPPPQSQSKLSDSATRHPESESDSDSDTDAPTNVKPKEETPTKKPRSKPAASASRSAVVKRAAGEIDGEAKDWKRVKIKDPETEGVGEKSEEKKHLFQRLWSQEDEIAVLEGVIDFTAKKGIDPSKDMNSFYEFIKNSLHFDVSLNQVKEKIGRLKKKFGKHVNRSKMGENMTFSKFHDQHAFDLWKKIWGSEATKGAEPSVKSNGKDKKIGNATNTRIQRGNSKSMAALKAELDLKTGKDKGGDNDEMEVEVEKNLALEQKVPFGVGGMEDYVINKGLDLVKREKKAEMEEKWRKLHVAELELFLKRHELIVEQAKLVLASYEAED